MLVEQEQRECVQCGVPIPERYPGGQRRPEKRMQKAQFCSRSCKLKHQWATLEEGAPLGGPRGVKRPDFSGPLHWNWQGGIARERDRAMQSAEYREWRRLVYERDNYTCQSCGWTGNQLNAHHIAHWALCDENRYDLDNGITLCLDCHRDVHWGRHSG